VPVGTTSFCALWSISSDTARVFSTHSEKHQRLPCRAPLLRARRGDRPGAVHLGNAPRAIAQGLTHRRERDRSEELWRCLIDCERLPLSPVLVCFASPV
jgi:hypothetical protein